MEQNMSGIDKKARIVIGLGIIALGLYYKSWLGLIGFIPIIIAYINWCPIYAFFGYSTNKKAKAVEAKKVVVKKAAKKSKKAKKKK